MTIIRFYSISFIAFFASTRSLAQVTHDQELYNVSDAVVIGIVGEQKQIVFGDNPITEIIVRTYCTIKGENKEIYRVIIPKGYTKGALYKFSTINPVFFNNENVYIYLTKKSDYYITTWSKLGKYNVVRKDDNFYIYRNIHRINKDDFNKKNQKNKELEKYKSRISKLQAYNKMNKIDNNSYSAC
jgi:hypothetical protein